MKAQRYITRHKGFIFAIALCLIHGIAHCSNPQRKGRRAMKPYENLSASPSSPLNSVDQLLEKYGDTINTIIRHIDRYITTTSYGKSAANLKRIYEAILTKDSPTNFKDEDFDHVYGELKIILHPSLEIQNLYKNQKFSDIAQQIRSVIFRIQKPQHPSLRAAPASSNTTVKTKSATAIGKEEEASTSQESLLWHIKLPVKIDSISGKEKIKNQLRELLKKATHAPDIFFQALDLLIQAIKQNRLPTEESYVKDLTSILEHLQYAQQLEKISTHINVKQYKEQIKSDIQTYIKEVQHFLYYPTIEAVDFLSPLRITYEPMNVRYLLPNYDTKKTPAFLTGSKFTSPPLSSLTQATNQTFPFQTSPPHHQPTDSSRSANARRPTRQLPPTEQSPASYTSMLPSFLQSPPRYVLPGAAAIATALVLLLKYPTTPRAMYERARSFLGTINQSIRQTRIRYPF